MRPTGPVNIIPFKIYNRPAFIEQDHPVINPVFTEYEEYWMSITDKII